MDFNSVVHLHGDIEMGFSSQLDKSKMTGRRVSSKGIVVSQIYKPSTKGEEISFRISTLVLKKFNANIGDRVDVLIDKDSGKLMIKLNKKGFLISGKENAPTGLIRYTLKEGHFRLSDDRALLPFKKEADEKSLEFDEDSVTFKLQSEVL